LPIADWSPAAVNDNARHGQSNGPIWDFAISNWQSAIGNDMRDWVALNMTPGIGPRAAAKLLERFGSAEAVYRATRVELEKVRLLPEAIDSIIARDMHEKAEAEIEKVRSLGGDILVLDDGVYPSLLREIFDPPVTLGAYKLYSYDPNGNRLTAPNLMGSPGYDAQDRLQSYNDAIYEYTANGELLHKTVDTAVTTYAYDVLGNLRTVTLPDDTAIDYIVDASNRRVGRRVTPLGGASATTNVWLYDAERLVGELDSSGTLVSQFVYGSHVNVPDYMVSQGDTYRILSDQLGSVRLVVRASDGTIAQRLDYDQFGRVTLDTSPSFQPFGFAGGLYDPDTGLVRFGRRDYDATIGRWIAKDPILFNGGDTNLYGYCLNDPVNTMDTTGLAVDMSCVNKCMTPCLKNCENPDRSPQSPDGGPQCSEKPERRSPGCVDYCESICVPPCRFSRT